MERGFSEKSERLSVKEGPGSLQGKACETVFGEGGEVQAIRVSDTCLVVSDVLKNCLSQRSRLALAEIGSQAKAEGERESFVLVGEQPR